MTPEIKDKILEHLREHQRHDRIIRGTYWENGKGCAVGCAINSWALAEGMDPIGIDYSDHAKLGRLLGPGGEHIAILADRIFEELPNGEAKAWAVDWFAAVPPDADLSMVWPRFAHWLLTEELPAKQRLAKCVVAVADLYQLCIDGRKPNAEEWAAAAQAAREAANAAWAASAALEADALWAVAGAADAACAVESVACAVESVAWAMDAECAASYRRQAEKLVELLREAK